MAQPVDQKIILSLLPDTIQQQITRLDVLPVVDSTNTYLLDLARQGAPSGAICFAHRQTAGRGRRGRAWISSQEHNIYASFLYHFSTLPVGLSVVVGIAIARVLTRFGVSDVGLKWPNDLYCEGKKLGGLLIEAGHWQQQHYAVIGVGINVALSQETRAQIDQPCIDMQSLVSVDINQLAADLIAELMMILPQVNLYGLTPFLLEWQQFDVLYGHSVSILQGSQTMHGIAKGIDEHGALLVEHNGEMQKVFAGEVSVRLTLPQ